MVLWLTKVEIFNFLTKKNIFCQTTYVTLRSVGGMYIVHSSFQHSFLTLSITDPQQDEQNGQKTLAEDGLVFRSPEMKRSLQRPNSSKKKKMSKKSKHTNRPQDRPKPSHPATANPANGHQNHHSKSNSSSEDSDNSDSFYETLRRHQRKHRTSSKNSSSNSNVSAAKK